MKDSKGHGSNQRGGSYPNIDKNLKGRGKHVGYPGPWQITKLGAGYLATHSKTGESFRGDTLGDVSRGLSDRDTSARDFLDRAAASSLANGPKSSAPSVHPAMTNSAGHAYGSPEAIKDFTDQYGKPRDHAAEQRSFNSGKREIARLQRKGK